MRRSRGSTSRKLGIILVIILAAGTLAAVYKLRPHFSQDPLAEMGSAQASPAARIGVPALAPAEGEPKAEQLAQATPLERPESPALADPIALATGVNAAPRDATQEISLGNHPLAEGQALYDEGELIRARALLNAALQSGKLSATEQDVARELMMKISQQTIFSPRIFKGDPHAVAYTVKPGDRLAKIAGGNAITWELIGRVNGISDPRKLRAFQTIKLIKGPFHVVVTKSTYVADVYLGAPGGPNSLYVTSFRVGLGQNDSTPTGTWLVQSQGKLKNPTYYSPRGEGIIAADDPSNPLGEYWIGLTGIDGQARDRHSYGIHGTIDPDSIGKSESMGCIRLQDQDIALMYEMLVEGRSTIVVKD